MNGGDLLRGEADGAEEICSAARLTAPADETRVGSPVAPSSGRRSVRPSTRVSTPPPTGYSRPTARKTAVSGVARLAVSWAVERTRVSAWRRPEAAIAKEACIAVSIWYIGRKLEKVRLAR